MAPNQVPFSAFAPRFTIKRVNAKMPALRICRWTDIGGRFVTICQEGNVRKIHRELISQRIWEPIHQLRIHRVLMIFFLWSFNVFKRFHKLLQRPSVMKHKWAMESYAHSKEIFFFAQLLFSVCCPLSFNFNFKIPPPHDICLLTQYILFQRLFIFFTIVQHQYWLLSFPKEHRTHRDGSMSKTETFHATHTPISFKDQGGQ